MTPTRDQSESAARFIPQGEDLAALREAANSCRGCSLYRHATQAVFGEGRRGAEILFIGEQPGDREDVTGKPFVGPAGKLLDKCLQEAGIDRSKVYVTNAVKHFKWEPRGKIRLHKKPDLAEIAACRPWLEREIAAVGPKLIVCLGATAAQEMLGNKFRLTRHRSEIFEQPNSPALTATIHPSAILRMPDAEARQQETAQFVSDLRAAAAYAARAHEPR
ncbi:MAG TPA: UdgX family uracil-DNA binding protein [Acidobacteriaceae bacterium]|nr:UdgX family uracil-DNA binding protein [Acidobacteriaceae bacterium]